MFLANTKETNIMTSLNIAPSDWASEPTFVELSPLTTTTPNNEPYTRHDDKNDS